MGTSEAPNVTLLEPPTLYVTANQKSKLFKEFTQNAPKTLNDVYLLVSELFVDVKL